MPNRVAIVGITGDPPTNGHLWLAQTAIAQGFDLVWLMPCYRHKYERVGNKRPTLVHHRYAMTTIAAASLNDKRIITSAYEITKESDGSCYYTTISLREDYPDWEFTWVIGMDNAIHFDGWEQASALKAGFVPFLVCSRPGVVVPEGSHWFQKPPHRFVKGDFGVECSSTEFKKLYQAGDPRCADLVPPGVLEYIRLHSLYREGFYESQTA